MGFVAAHVAARVAARTTRFRGVHPGHFTSDLEYSNRCFLSPCGSPVVILKERDYLQPLFQDLNVVSIFEDDFYLFLTRFRPVYITNLTLHIHKLPREHLYLSNYHIYHIYIYQNK